MSCVTNLLRTKRPMIISPFTPLFFHPSADRHGIESDYIQKFAPSDRIFVQVISEYWESDPEVYVKNIANEYSDKIHLNSWNINQSKTIYFHSITGLNNGFYTITINGFQSNVFQITDDVVELSETTLIQYSMKGNNQRNDCAFWIDNMQYFFDFRAPGGFKDENWSFGVSNEQFVMQNEDVIELYSHEYSLHTFTLGNAMGCPVWFAELLNRILCCNYVYFDGIRFARKESNVPEIKQQIEGLKSFVFNQMLQKVRTMSPVLEWTNQLSIRRTQSDIYRITADDGELRRINSGLEKNIVEESYINLTKATSNTGTSINSDTMVGVNSIHHPGVDEQSYWDLITIKTSDIDNKYIGRKGYGKLVVSGLDNLKKILADDSINLCAVLQCGDSYINLIEGNVISMDGVCILKGISGSEVNDLTNFQLYLDNIYDCHIDNIGMTIKLTWICDND